MSADLAQLEQRLTSVETALSQVQQQLGLATPTTNWVDIVSGSLEDFSEEEYQRFLECCAAVRKENSLLNIEEPPS